MQVPFREFSRILITGSSGQIGSHLLNFLYKSTPPENIMCIDINKPKIPIQSPFIKLDIQEESSLQNLVQAFKPDTIYHLASILSAQADTDPVYARFINIDGTHNILDAAASQGAKLFVPSSVGAFGPKSSKRAGNLEVMNPISYYGVSKVYIELIGEYYQRRYGLDFRSIRLPLVISGQSGKGSASFTVKMIFDLMKTGKTVIPIRPEAGIMIMHINDALNSIVKLMQADQSQLSARCYTIPAVSCTVQQYTHEVLKVLRGGNIQFEPDFRSDIMQSVPYDSDGNIAEKDWGCQLTYGLKDIVEDVYREILIRTKT